MEPARCPVDAFLLAARMTDDAILAYHTALAFHGRAHSVSHEFRYLTARHARALAWRGERFRPVTFPAALRGAKQESFGVKTVDRLGLSVRVTTHERTLVDVLDRPDLGGGWEEVWRSLESVEFFDLEQVVAYALLLDNATTAAKVGFFLETHRKTLMVPDGPLARLRARRPVAPHYLDPSAPRGRGRLVAAWNLVVPAEILDRTWEEPA
jgi:predicted transcriptional regulator of viral defense system